jgi:hypothetical protein
MKKLLLLLILLFPITASAANLYTQDFSGTEPPDNWSIAYAARPTEMSGCTFTAQSGVGYMSLTTTTNTNAKIAYFAYPGGVAWSNYTLQFKISSSLTNQSTWYHWGVYYPGSGSTTQVQFYYIPGMFWRLQLGSETLNRPTFSAGDVVKVYKYGSDLRIFKNDELLLQTTSSETSAGTIYFGIQRTLTGYSNFNISDLTVDEATPEPSATPTSTLTLTLTPTITPTPTNTPYVTPTPTRIPWYPLAVSTVSLPKQPQAVCYYKDKVWVTYNEEVGQVAELNKDTLAIEHTINTGGSNPMGIHGAFDYIWVTNQTSMNLTRIDASYTPLLFGNWGSPYIMTHDDTYLFLAAEERYTNEDIVVKINPDTCEAAETIYLNGINGMPYGMAFFGTKLFVGRYLKPDVVVVDTVGNTIITSIPLTGSPSDIVSFNGNIYVASWGEGVLWKINPNNYNITIVPLDFYVPGASWVIYGVTNSDDYVYTTDYEAARVHKIFTAQNLDIGWADVGNNPQGITYGNDFIYTSDSFNHSVVKIYPGEDYIPIVSNKKTNHTMVWDSWIKKIWNFGDYYK